MNNNKPFFEKFGFWVTSIAAICTILGISVFNGRSLVNDKDITYENVVDSNEKDESNESQQSSLHKDDDPSQQNKNDVNEQEKSLISEQNENELDNPSVNSVEPFIISTPKQDGVTCADWYNWTEDDKDIMGNTYSSSTAIKLSVYNTINAMAGGSHDITAELHIPLGEKYNGSWDANFVVAKEMVGNGSSAKITIFSGENEIVPTFTMDSTTTDEIIYKIDLDGIRDLIIRFECHTVGNGFWAGVIFE